MKYVYTNKVSTTTTKVLVHKKPTLLSRIASFRNCKARGVSKGPNNKSYKQLGSL